MTCSFAQENDTICIKIPTYKEVLKLAEKGASCDSITFVLSEQIEKDRARSVEMVNDLNKLDKKNKIFKGLSFGLGFVAVLEFGFLLILLL